nr:immunoglobulin light chain junction region [Macaca mulatta]MOX71086.1 immunoglobulin light chain junction region [Macaca mulatta]MOX71471.1 immunoglobulin light chain junction region [Macaca mulatta]MOX71685.1 immunoglobulin light chain junction region [Macaca mulatta]MOX73441.1 immunoglobulin light chain junction region [Macaca mulatta]
DYYCMIWHNNASVF